MGAGRETGGREAGLTPALARFLARSRWEDIPAVIRHEGKRGLLNALGCILAGRDDPAIAIVRSVFPLEDALIDAAAATAHDYDDTHLPTVIHATPPVAGVVLSIARKQEVSGAELLHDEVQPRALHAQVADQQGGERAHADADAEGKEHVDAVVLEEPARDVRRRAEESGLSKTQ